LLDEVLAMAHQHDVAGLGRVGAVGRGCERRSEGLGDVVAERRDQPVGELGAGSAGVGEPEAAAGRAQLVTAERGDQRGDAERGGTLERLICCGLGVGRAHRHLEAPTEVDEAVLGEDFEELGEGGRFAHGVGGERGGGGDREARAAQPRNTTSR
jgi:hypothetical protein